MDIGDVFPSKSGESLWTRVGGRRHRVPPVMIELTYRLTDAALQPDVGAAEKAQADILHLVTCVVNYAKQTRATMDACAKISGEEK